MRKRSMTEESCWAADYDDYQLGCLETGMLTAVLSLMCAVVLQQFLLQYFSHILESCSVIDSAIVGLVGNFFNS